MKSNPQLQHILLLSQGLDAVVIVSKNRVEVQKGRCVKSAGLDDFEALKDILIWLTLGGRPFKSADEGFYDVEHERQLKANSELAKAKPRMVRASS